MTMNLPEIGQRIRQRRDELGLSQDRLAKLADLSRVTINQLETGAIADLGVAKLIALLNLLGMSLEVHAQTHQSHGLRMASHTASVSYRRALTSGELSHALAHGVLSREITPHVATLLDEAPLPVIVSAVAQAAKIEKVAPKQIWRNVIKWAQAMGSPRKVWA